MRERNDGMEITSADLLDFRTWYSDWLARRMHLETYRDCLRDVGMSTADTDSALAALDAEYEKKWGRIPGIEELPVPDFKIC
jgi:hypothetical protein